MGFVYLSLHVWRSQYAQNSKLHNQHLDAYNENHTVCPCVITYMGTMKYSEEKNLKLCAWEEMCECEMCGDAHVWTILKVPLNAWQ